MAIKEQPKKKADLFNLSGKIVVITGGAGLLGTKHAEAVAEFGAIPVILDLNGRNSQEAARRIASEYGVEALGEAVDITKEEEVVRCAKRIENAYGRVDVLINNAARNPKVEDGKDTIRFSRLENFDLRCWTDDLAVGLTGAFLCSKHFGPMMVANPRGGSIINISSDLGLIAPDQRIYSQNGIGESRQQVKPVSYSVVKSGIIGLTRYLATYWASKNVRANVLCPGGVYNGQNRDFVKRIIERIPMGRMASADEYKGVIVFLSSDASAYMNGAVIAFDGGRTCW